MVLFHSLQQILVILMNKDRKRNKEDRNSKRVILVAYEGDNKTEKNYFNNFQGSDKNYRIKVVPGNETDPINLVKQTIQKVKELRLDLDEDDRAFCVFDTDTNKNKNAQIKEAIELAKEENIIIITSTPCIELWFLLHYDYTTATMSNEQVMKKLKKFYPNYKKNSDIYPAIKDNTLEACKRAIELEKNHERNGLNIQSVEANPHSEVHKIIEEFNN